MMFSQYIQKKKKTLEYAGKHAKFSEASKKMKKNEKVKAFASKQFP